MEKRERVALAITAFVLCINWGMDQDNASVSGGGVKPSVNFQGAIQDNTGKEFNAKHITVSGIYKQIPVYAKPKDMKDDEYNPTINTVRLDLAEVSKIVVPHPNDIHLFNNRKYIEIEVYSKDAPQTKNSYLIENSKKILCDQVNQAGPIERELAFPAIQHIEITHYEKPQSKDDDHPKVRAPKPVVSKKPAPMPKKKAPKPKPKKKMLPKKKKAPALPKAKFSPPKPPMPKKKAPVAPAA